MSGGEHIVEGHAAPGREKFYRSVPFEMPARVSRLHVRYDYSDAIGSDPHLTGGNTVDIGLFDWRGDEFLNAGFRGWSGSARREFYISAHDATPGYLPGPLRPGTWYVALGFYKVGPRGCDYRVTISFEFDGQPADDGAFPPLLTLAGENARIRARAGGWYRGELHCHSLHSDGDSSVADVLAAAAALGLDFLAVTDHNNITHLAEMAALDSPDLVLIPGYEVTTYHGHWNIWGSEAWVDFRVATAQQMEQAIRFAREHSSLISCNHPRPNGPPWAFADVSGYHAVEVWNGPWRLFNDEALAFWEARLRRGERLVALGGSDMHCLKTDHHARLGTPTTWIYCPGQPTAARLLAGLRAGHAFISDTPRGPALYLSSGHAMAGDTVARPADNRLPLHARVCGAAGLTLEIHGAGGRLHHTIIEDKEQTVAVALPVEDTPYIRAQLVDARADITVMRALSNPIYIEP